MQKAQEKSDVADKVDGTLEDIGVVEDFSNIHLNEVRLAAIYLSASVMDYLSGLIEWVEASSIFSTSPCHSS